MKIELQWSELKNLIQNKNLPLQYIQSGKFYKIWICEGTILYTADIYISDPASNDQQDFEDNYKDSANKPIDPKDIDGKLYVRAESRPLNKTTYFTCAGDDTLSIGDGKLLQWDFSNSDDEITAPTGYKRKRLEFSFIDPINIKEGSIYYDGALFDSYLDFYVVCPDGEYYLDNNNSLQLATEDTIIDHFVNKHKIKGVVNMGDELNTEAASTEIPITYKFWIDITVPLIDITSTGFISLELYRSRTVIL